MIRKIIHIDQKKCNGCGACATACHEGAIDIVDGKAKLVREHYCDGLGDCLPVCPTGAIYFEEREAPAYDEAAVLAAKRAKQALRPESGASAEPLPCGCPGMHVKTLRPQEGDSPSPAHSVPSRLAQWPVQIKLIPITAPFLENADLLIAADCTAYAYGNFHEEFIKGRVAIIGCPKLDEGDYADKLTQIFALNNIRSITVVRMEVPCCGGIENAVKRALAACGKSLPAQTVILSANGEKKAVTRLS